jgi:hypothetical protein
MNKEELKKEDNRKEELKKSIEILDNKIKSREVTFSWRPFNSIENYLVIGKKKYAIHKPVLREVYKAELKGIEQTEQKFKDAIEKLWKDNIPTKGEAYLDNEFFIILTESKKKELLKSLEEKKT